MIQRKIEKAKAKPRKQCKRSLKCRWEICKCHHHCLYCWHWISSALCHTAPKATPSIAPRYRFTGLKMPRALGNFLRPFSSQLSVPLAEIKYLLKLIHNVSTRAHQMCLLNLPTELLLLLPTFLKTERDISSLSRTCVQLHLLLNPWLYRYNSRYCSSSSLLWAAKNGNEATARFSIQEGGDVGLIDDIGRTPLCWAARSGHEAVVKLLLETGKVDVESRDAEGRTILFWAAANGHEAVVKLLIQRGSVDTSSRDTVGWTVLFWPAANGHEAVVELILATGRVDVNCKDTEGRTPLYMAAARGHEAVVRLLVEERKVDLDSKDSQGRPLSYWPAVNGHKAVAKVLREAGDVHVDTTLIPL